MKSDHILFFTPTKKYIEFSYAIRKGICENCGKSKAKREISVTNLHHKNNKYDLENPLWNTIEVCLECHEKLDPRLKALKKNQRYWLGSNAHKMRCPTCQHLLSLGMKVQLHTIYIIQELDSSRTRIIQSKESQSSHSNVLHVREEDCLLLKVQ